MTDEELDKARADEAWRIYMAQTDDRSTAHQIAARLAREGWMPVDPDLIEARECVSKAIKAINHSAYGEKYAKQHLDGEHDDSWPVQAALLAIRRAKEKAKK